MAEADGARSGARGWWRDRTRLWKLLGAVASGVLLAMAFPPMGDRAAAWFALVPILLAGMRCGAWEGFGYGFLSGAVFWLLSLSWLLSLGRTGGPWPAVVVGWGGLAGYCALYTGGFMMTVSALLHERPKSKGSGGTEKEGAWSSVARSLRGMIMIPLLWVGFEYVRSVLVSGFPWNTLGVSQYENLVVIQVAQWGGVYAVSAMVMTVNVALALSARHFWEVFRRRARRRILVEVYVAALLVGLGLFAGGATLARSREPGAEFLVRAIQPNIPQMKKWPEEFAGMIYGSLEEKTEMARIGEPDLLVWPETALPGLIPEHPVALEFVRTLAGKGVPLLVGAMENARDAKWNVPRFYNSSFLFDGQGNIREVYRKRHLVPFGEYIPMDRQIRWLAEMAPLGFSCLPGRSNTVFRMALHREEGGGSASEVVFAALICFEDTFAYLARESVRGGARLLINQTNDAWFDGTAGAVQHMSHCVFRCVENRVPAVRVANTGVTCFIDRNGRIDGATRELLRRGHERFVDFRTGRMEVPPAGLSPTFYTTYGDLPFAAPCGVCSGFMLLWIAWREKRKKALERRGGIPDTGLSLRVSDSD